MDKPEINYSLEKQRLTRLKNMNSMLGQPDLITILKATTVSSFLSHKKHFQRQQMFVFGLNFPTTAHFSSYINDRFNVTKKQNKIETEYKIKLFMYDIFKKIDFIIEVNVPGSIVMRAYSLNGQPINASNIPYHSVYLSSILRSLYPSYYHPSTQIHGEVEKYEVLQNFIKTFVPFALKNQLQIPEDIIHVQNLGIEFVSNYLKSHCFWNLCHVFHQELLACFPEKALVFLLQIKQLKGQYKDVVVLCASQLMKEGLDNQKTACLIQFQIRCLSKLGKKTEAKYLGQNVVRQGLDNLQTWQQILKIYFEEGDDRTFFKLLNTSINFSGEDTNLKQKLQKLAFAQKIFQFRKQIQNQPSKGKNISKYCEYMLKFDYNFMQMDTKLKSMQELLQKTQKQKATYQIMHRMDLSMKNQTFYQKFVALFQKNRGWAKLIQMRNQCFWLENDYVLYENSLKKKSSDISYRFMNESLSEIQSEKQKSIDRSTLIKNKQKSNLKSNEKYEEEQRKAPNMDQSFDGQFSDTQSSNERQINVVAPCSKRVATKRVSRQQLSIKKIEFVKVICNYNLQKMFLTAYNNLKLHNDIQKWSSKLDLSGMSSLTKPKKQLIAYFMLKKGFIHKNMLRFRKSQQAFKNARKCSIQPITCLISSYSLAKLYLEHNNIKGVEYYTVEIVRILFSIGIQQFEAVPVWAKQIIPYIIKHHGRAITKRLQGPLKQIVELWLGIDYKTIRN